MELIRNTWTKKDGQDFIKYLKTLSNPSKEEWTRKIINTKMPLLALKSKQIQELRTQIAKGNYKAFLDLKLFEILELQYIYVGLLFYLKDYELVLPYLEAIVPFIDNWAVCDSIPFKKMQGKDREKFFTLAKNWSKSSLPFQRRIGIKILFEYTKATDKANEIFEILNNFETETHYYVDMINAWLTCEMFIKQKALTLQFLKTNKLNKFTINKAIQKCRDSFRVTDEEKQFLLKYKR